MIIKITNGEVEVKESYTRKLKKEITKVMTENVNFDSDGKATGFRPEALDRANDVALVGMINRITVDGIDLTVNIDTIDNLDAKEVDLIIDRVNTVKGDTVPLT